MTTGPLRVRFAPSPTGMFHVGVARSALQNWYLAKQHRRAVRAAHRGHRRGPQPPGVDRGHPRTRWSGSASSADDRATRGRTSSRPTPQSTQPPRQRLYAAGAAYYCDCTREHVSARAARPEPRLRRVLPRPRASAPGEGRALRFRDPGRGRTVVVDLVRGRADVRQRHRSRTSSSPAATARRCSCWPTSSTT